MLTTKVVGVEGGREPACSEFPSAVEVSIVPTQRQFTLGDLIANKASCKQLIFWPRIWAEISWFLSQEYELKSADLLAKKTTMN